MPASHVFEGMRGVIQNGVLEWSYMFKAMALNAVYLVLGAMSFMLFYRSARQRGMLLQMGE